MHNQRRHKPLSNLIFYATLHTASCHLKPFWAPMKSWEIPNTFCATTAYMYPAKTSPGENQEKDNGLSNCCPRPVGRALTLRYFNASLDFSAVCLRARYQSLLSFKCNWWKEEITTQRRTHKTEKEEQFQVLCTDFVETKTTQSTDSEFSAAVMRPKILITPKRVNQSIHQPESMFVVRYYIVLNSVVKIKAVYKGEKGI